MAVTCDKYVIVIYNDMLTPYSKLRINGKEKRKEKKK